MGDFLKTLAGKVASGAIALAVVAAGLAWFETDPVTKHSILSFSGRMIGWFALMLVLPWANFALIGWVNRLQQNAAGAAFILVLTVVDAIVLAWLVTWTLHGATEWVLYTAAILIAGVYNLFTCDLIAEKLE